VMFKSVTTKFTRRPGGRVKVDRHGGQVSRWRRCESRGFRANGQSSRMNSSNKRSGL
jgi:hypothetical protein